MAMTHLAFTLALLPLVAHAQLTLHDDRFAASLFAGRDQVVTPIGAAVGPDDRLYVIESHTHHPPSDYPGPEHDRIKVFTDADNDGTPESVAVFADGLDQAMNLTFNADGTLVVVCARQVVALPDHDRDLRADSTERLLTLETKERYAHNSLLAITASEDGHLYIARGNTGSHAHRLVGTDGSAVSGYGDGGSAVRCRTDGSRVEPFATGFWNPFDLKFDHAGHLLLVDNDPDARGPNRLIHVVPGGDYGYRSIYGGTGTHPLQGWDGDLPGTLPILAGTGEAPSGLIDARRLARPAGYDHTVLVTVWNEHTIDRFDLTAHPDHTLTSTPRKTWLSGPKDFRPVALAADSRGNLFVTDWVKVDYPNHGHGRIWRITAKPAAGLNPPAPFDRNLASAPQRPAPPEPSLTHPDPGVRRAALVLAAESRDPTARQDLAAAIRPANTTPQLFRTYLAAHAALAPEFLEAYRKQSSPRANKLPLEPDSAILDDAVRDTDLPPAVRAVAVSLLDDPPAQRLKTLATSTHPALATAAVRRLADKQALHTIASDTDKPAALRAEALVSLAHHAPDAVSGFATDADPTVALTARRLLGKRPPEPDRPTTREAWHTALATGGDPAAGARVFRSPHATCANCHTVDGTGGQLGPDLSGLAQSMGRAQIVDAILAPSESFAPQYQAWVVTLKDGTVHTGVQLDHKAGGAIELFTTENRTRRFAGKDIASHDALPISLMPPGLENYLTLAELRDLLAFLSTP